MSLRLILPTLALAILASGAAFAVEAEAPAPQPLPKGEAPAVKAGIPGAPAKAEPAAVCNSACPMDGRKVDPKAGTVPIVVGTGSAARPRAMGFCSMHCCAAFAKEPEPGQSGVLAPGTKPTIW